MSTTAFKTFSGSCPNSCKDILDVKTMGIALSQHGGEIHDKKVYQNCKNMFTPTWPSPKQISVITFSTKCQGPGTSRASAGTPLQTAFFSTNHKFEDIKKKETHFEKHHFAELDVKTIEKDPCDHFLYKITGSWYPSSRGRDTTSNPIFSTNYKFEDIKENKNTCEKTHFAALDVKTIEKNPCDHFLYKISGFWYLSSRCRDTILNPTFDDIKENKLILKKLIQWVISQKKIPQQVYFSVHLCGSADPRKNKSKV